MSGADMYLDWLWDKYGDDRNLEDLSEEEMEEFLAKMDEIDNPFNRSLEFLTDELADAVMSTLKEPPKWDVFISYAGEHIKSVTVPLIAHLRKRKVTVWFDEEVYPRDAEYMGRLYPHLNEGIARSLMGVVVLSPEYLTKQWPKLEFSGLGLKGVGRLFFVLHGADPGTLGALRLGTVQQVLEMSAGVASTGGSTLAVIAEKIALAVKALGNAPGPQ